MQLTFAVSEMENADIDSVVAYWRNADPQHLLNMGVDSKKIPSQQEFTRWLQSQLNLPIEKKNAYYLLWKVDGETVGHCNTNPTLFSKNAYMHLHIWNSRLRKKGSGVELLKMTLPYFFDKLRLEHLYCQPYAHNPAPNKTLQKAGFQFVKEYITTPGWFNFEQPVCLWEMTSENFKRISAKSE